MSAGALRKLTSTAGRFDKTEPAATKSKAKEPAGRRRYNCKAIPITIECDFECGNV